MPAPIFKNPEHQALFDRQGYLVVPFIKPEKIRELDRLFDDLHPELPAEGFIAGSYSSDFNYKKTASNQIVERFQESFAELFQNYRSIGAAFLYKMPGPKSDLMMHQDWTIVDEEQFVAVNVWVPLIEITAQNGPLMVLPGSHYPSVPTLRAPTLPFYFTGHESRVKEALIPIYTKPGEAVILNQSLVHYSPANQSGTIRKAITAGVVSEEASLRFCYYDQSDESNPIEIFAQDDDFLIRFENFYQDIFKRPTGVPMIERVSFNVPRFSTDEMEKTLQAIAARVRQPKPKKMLFQTIKSWFN